MVHEKKKRLVQVTFKKGLYLSTTEYKDEDRGGVLCEILKYDALAVYETEDSPYDEILILPISSPLDCNYGYTSADEGFIRFVEHVTKDDLVDSVRVNVLNGDDLDEATGEIVQVTQGFHDYSYNEIKYAYEEKYGKETEKWIR